MVLLRSRCITDMSDIFQTYPTQTLSQHRHCHKHKHISSASDDFLSRAMQRAHSAFLINADSRLWKRSRVRCRHKQRFPDQHRLTLSRVPYGHKQRVHSQQRLPRLSSSGNGPRSNEPTPHTFYSSLSQAPYQRYQSCRWTKFTETCATIICTDIAVHIPVLAGGPPARRADQDRGDCVPAAQGSPGSPGWVRASVGHLA
jgi:hypothetical protein